MYARLDYVKRERSTATICIFRDSYITWASVALRFGSSTLGTRLDRLWLSAQTHTHTSNCCASTCTRSGETWAPFQFLPPRQSRKWVPVPVRSRGKWGTRGKGALETFGSSLHHNQPYCCNGKVTAGRRRVLAAAASLMCYTWDYSDVMWSNLVHHPPSYFLLSLMWRIILLWN